MKKLFSSSILLLVFLFSQSVIAASYVPNIPTGCFDDDATYCSDYGVAHSSEAGRKVIKVDFYAKLDGLNFEDEWEIYDLFADFEAWGDYTSWVEDYGSISTDKKAKKSAKKALEDHNVTMLSSVVADSIELEDGVEALVHEVTYFTAGPWPFTTNKIVERALYYEIPAYEGALISMKMILDPSYADQLKGLKYKTGILHIGYDEEEDAYMLYFKLEVVPEIDLLPSIAAPYVGKAFISVFEGMFADYL